MKTFLIAWQFLTRLPLKRDLQASNEEFATSIKAYPLVGFCLGLLIFLLNLFFWKVLKFPLFLQAVLILILEVALTGGIHLDGLMDCADGFLNNFHKDKEEIIKIMKDSRVGANGVLVLVSFLLLKLALLLSLVRGKTWLLILVPIFSRWLLLYLSVFYPYGGLKGSLGGMVIGQKKKKEFLSGSLSTLVLVLVTLVGVQVISQEAILEIGIYASSFGLSSFLLGRFLAERVQRKFAGITGDLLGAALEISQVFMLLLGVIIGSLFS